MQKQAGLLVKVCLLLFLGWIGCVNRSLAEDYIPYGGEYSSRVDASSYPSTSGDINSSSAASNSYFPYSDPDSKPVVRLPDVLPRELKTPNEANGEKNGNQKLGGGFPGFGGMGGAPSPLKYEIMWYPSVSVRGQDTSFASLGQNLSAMYPFYRSPPNMWMLSVNVKNRSIDTDAVMPDDGLAYPDQLWSVSIGLMYMRQMENGWTVSGGLNIGSASDHPFEKGSTLNVGMNAMLRIPSKERNAWQFMVMYSPLGEIKIPIPGVSYFYNPNDQFQMNIGLPFQLRYKPDEHWSFEASYMLIHTIHAKIAYRLTDQWSLFTGYDWTNDAYQLTEIDDTDKRFYLYDQRVSGGVEASFGRFGHAVLAGGYAFDRYSFIGKQWDSSEYDRVSIGDGPFISLNYDFRF